MNAVLNVQFERVELSDTTQLRAWTADAEVLPSEVFLYEYDNVDGAYRYSRVCRYADLVNWRTARQDANDRFLRREYVNVSASCDSTVNNLEAGIRDQVDTLLSDVSGCTDGAVVDYTFSGSGFSVSGAGRSGIESVRVDLSLWRDGSGWPALVLHNEYPGLADERSGSLLSVATVRDMEDIALSGYGSGDLWRSSSGTAVVPCARLSELLDFVSGDLQELHDTPAWSGTAASGTAATTGDIYL